MSPSHSMNPRPGKGRSSFLIFISDCTMRPVSGQTQYVVSVSFSFWDFVNFPTPAICPTSMKIRHIGRLGKITAECGNCGDSVNIYKPLDFFDFDFNLAQMRFKGWFCLWGTPVAKRR